MSRDEKLGWAFSQAICDNVFGQELVARSRIEQEDFIKKILRQFKIKDCHYQINARVPESTVKYVEELKTHLTKGF